MKTPLVLSTQTSHFCFIFLKPCDRQSVLPPGRFPDGTVKLRNPHIAQMDQDILYHLALGSGSHDLVEMFSDVRFVCMGGTPKRMEVFANFIMDEIGYKLPPGTTLLDISYQSYRYSMYKVGRRERVCKVYNA